MTIKCYNCGYVRKDGETTSPSRCPSCSISYKASNTFKKYLDKENARNSKLEQLINDKNAQEETIKKKLNIHAIWFTPVLIASLFLINYNLFWLVLIMFGLFMIPYILAIKKYEAIIMKHGLVKKSEEPSSYYFGLGVFVTTSLSFIFYGLKILLS